MSAEESRSVIIERDVPHPPEKIWRALTQPHLLAEWLMANDFAAVPDHRFQFRGDWGSVDCKVMNIEPNRALSYSWVAMGLESLVTWTLSPTRTGTHLRMEHSGFKPGQAYAGAKQGWQNFLGKLEQLLEKEP